MGVATDRRSMFVLCNPDMAGVHIEAKSMLVFMVISDQSFVAYDIERYS